MAIVTPTMLMIKIAEDWEKVLTTLRRRFDSDADAAVSLILARLFLTNFRPSKSRWRTPYLDSPCLMFSQNSTNNWKIFHSLYNEFYIFDFPELKGAEICFAKDGWLLMSGAGAGDCALFFFNPCTRAKFVLPPVPTRDRFVLPPVPTRDRFVLPPVPTRDRFVLPPVPDCFVSVCFTSAPTSGDCCIFGLFDVSTCYNVEYGFIRFGEDEWEVGEWGFRHVFLMRDWPPVFHGRMFYVLDSSATSVLRFDPTEEVERRWERFGILYERNHESDDDESDDESDDDDDDGGEDEDGDEEEEEDDDSDEEEEDDDEEYVPEIYMVEVDGDVWTVFLRNKTGCVRVQKLDLVNMRWRKMDSLGDKCLYLSKKGSFARGCLGSDMANKIYFNRFYGNNGVIYCMSTGMYYSVGGNYASKEIAGNTTTKEAYGPGLAQPYNATWIKPYRN